MSARIRIKCFSLFLLVPGSISIGPGFVFTESFLCRLLTNDKFASILIILQDLYMEGKIMNKLGFLFEQLLNFYAKLWMRKHCGEHITGLYFC